MKGWLKLHRQITEWEWYDDANTFRLLIHLLIMANSKDAFGNTPKKPFCSAVALIAAMHENFLLYHLKYIVKEFNSFLTWYHLTFLTFSK